MTTRVVAAGTFDGIHPGHESFLVQAKALGDELIVIIGRDANVAKRKGHPPRFNEQERLTVVAALPMVDWAVLGSLTDYLVPVVELKPNVLALGYDQWADEARIKQQLVERGLPNLEIVRLKAFEPERYHASMMQKSEVRNQKSA